MLLKRCRVLRGVLVYFAMALRLVIPAATTRMAAEAQTVELD